MTVPEKIVLLDGARTPVGSFGGALRDVPAHELGAAAARAALARAGVAGADIGEVVMGCIGQVGPDAFNARRVALAAGVPVSVPAYTVNRLCGSGLQAVWSAAMQMRWGGVELALAGGNENMSRMPFYDFDARRGHKLGDRALVDGTVAMLTDPFHGVHMGITAENVARTYGISRREQDEFAVESQRRAATAAARAAFARGDHPGRDRRPPARHRRHRRAPHTRDHPRHPGRAAPGLRQGRHRHRRQRLRHQRRRRRGRAGPRVGGPRAGPDRRWWRSRPSPPRRWSRN